ncbi:MAG TPA: AsmA family protein [Candidatus Omnitrophota bacterium]|nr:AsmA family protein [Candidatus Omnitrophota bacterium]HPD84937.1 AsmA family protein [Candidatus Omnitrophota bacterium]HRZ03795.1 AsmA family protein [Candidatus Omnitrophota bacterium]
MKALKTIFIIFLAVIVIFGVAVFIFLKTFDVNKYKPKILQQITKAIGRSADIQSLGLEFLPGQGVILNIKGLSIADNPEFSKENFLTVENINLGINFYSYVTTRQIIVSSLQIQSPKVILIRDKDGKFNVQTFEITKDKVSRNDSAAGAGGLFVREAFAADGSTAEKGPLPALLIKSIRLNSGIVVYKDDSFDPAISLEINQLGLRVDDFSLDKPFEFFIDGSWLSARKNITAQGRGQADITNNALRLTDTKVISDLSDISLEQLLRSLPMLQTAGLQKNLEGQIQANIKEMVVGAKGLMALALEGKLAAGKMKTKYIELPLENIAVNIRMTEKALEVTDSSLDLGKGSIVIQGRIDDYMKAQDFKFNIQADDLDLKEIIAQKDPSVQFEGKLFGKFDTAGSGLSAGPAILDSLKGNGTLEVKEGKLVGINVLKLVLSKISMLPHLSEEIEANLPEKYKAKLNEKDTAFNKIRLNTTIAGHALAVDSAEVLADAFELSGNGQIKFNQELGMETLIAVPADLSKSMAASAQGLEYLLDENGRVSIPVRVSGKIPNLAFYPDLEYLGKRIMVNKGRQELDKVLDKVFKSSEDNQSAPSGTEGQTTTPDGQNQKPPERQIIEDLLDKFLKKSDD